MGPFKLYYDYRDILRAPRLALSGKKIWILIIGNIAGFITYWVFSYLSLYLAGITIGNAISQYGLYPCLYGNEAEWYSWLLYYLGIIAWVIAIIFSSTAVSRVTLKQLKGNDFFSASDAWSYVHRHWHAIVFSPVAITLIIVFFILFATFFALACSIPYLGEFLFAVPYLLYLFGSIFTIYSLIVLFVSFLYTPSIVGVYEEDTMGTVFNSYSITAGNGWRVIVYNILLFPLLVIGMEIFSWFAINGVGFINYIFGCEWFMDATLANMTSYASSLVCPQWMCETIACIRNEVAGWFGLYYNVPSIFSANCSILPIAMSSTETIASTLLSISYLLIGFSILSYGLSIISVGETIMFIIFKKKSDDDDLLQRKDEDEIEDEIEDEFTFEDEDIDEQDTSSTSKEDDSNTNGLDGTDDNPIKEDE